MVHQSQLIDENTSLSFRLHKLLKNHVRSSTNTPKSLNLEFDKFGYRYATYDYFREQSESPDLMQRRGLRPGQPLPPELELFDDKGMFRSPLTRKSIVNLHNWLQDDQQILDWFFPEGLSEEWHKRLLEEMAIVWEHFWSPRHAIQTTLDDWPENLLERETTLAAIEQPLIDALLAAETEGGAEEE